MPESQLWWVSSARHESGRTRQSPSHRGVPRGLGVKTDSLSNPSFSLLPISARRIFLFSPIWAQFPSPLKQWDYERPLPAILCESSSAYRMRQYHGGRSEWIFHHETDQGHAEAGDRIRGLYRAFSNAVVLAGLPEDLNQHDLRHRGVTTWLAAGKSPALVQKAMGHSDLKTTMGYAHLVPDDLLALVETDEEKRASCSSRRVALSFLAGRCVHLCSDVQQGKSRTREGRLRMGLVRIWPAR